MFQFLGDVKWHDAQRTGLGEVRVFEIRLPTTDADLLLKDEDNN